MTMDATVVFLVLLSALMHAAWNAMVRSGADTLIALFLVKGPTMFVAAAVLAVVGLPSLESWPYLLASTAITAAYFYFLTNAYRVGDLSVGYPVARGVAPVVVLLLSAAFVGERPTVSGLLGVAIISLGVLILAWRSDARGPKPAAIFWAIGVGLTIAAYTVSDGLGGRASGNPIGYAAVLNIMTGIVLCGAVVFLRGAEPAFASLRQWKTGLAGGVLMFGAYAVVIYALSLAPIAGVAALRETGVIFAAIIGTLVLKEPLGARRIVASVVVAAGVVLLVVGR